MWEKAALFDQLFCHRQLFVREIVGNGATRLILEGAGDIGVIVSEYLRQIGQVRNRREVGIDIIDDVEAEKFRIVDSRRGIRRAFDAVDAPQNFQYHRLQFVFQKIIGMLRAFVDFCQQILKITGVMRQMKTALAFVQPENRFVVEQRKELARLREVKGAETKAQRFDVVGYDFMDFPRGRDT